MVQNQSPLRVWIPCIAFCSLATVASADVAETPAPAAEQSAWTLSTPFDWVNSVFTKASEDYGVLPSFSYTASVQGNPTGGMSRGAAYVHNIVFGADLDLDKIAGIPGASITISGVHAAGRNLSSRNIGNTFTVSQAFVGHGTYLYELYWQQEFAEDNVVLQVGRLNSSNFATLPAFGLQVNGGINGNPESLPINASFEGTPDAVWGADVTVKPGEDYYVSAGVFQATPLAGNQHGTDFSFRSSDRLLVMTEVGWTPTFGKTADSDGLGGTYIAGMYYSNLARERFDGNGDVKNTVGFYLMAQQAVWQSSSNKAESIDVWGGVTYSPQTEVAQMPFMGFAGVVWNGLIPGRDNDQLLGTLLVGTFSKDYADTVQAAAPQDGRPTYEMVLELSYVFNINSYAFIQPDIQYVIRPNGMKNIQDALVVGFQFGVNF